MGVAAINLGVILPLTSPPGGWVARVGWWLAGLGLGAFLPLAAHGAVLVQGAPERDKFIVSRYNGCHGGLDHSVPVAEDAAGGRRRVAMRPWTRWQHWIAVLVGIWLFISPWVLTTTGSAEAAWNAWIIGAAIFVVALIALGAPSNPTADWINVVLGVWLFISPWVLRYTGVKDGSWNAWIFGVVTVILALWALQTRGELPRGPQRSAGRLDTR
jgi:hypothetical protein